jgi:hypothetical protein
MRRRALQALELTSLILIILVVSPVTMASSEWKKTIQGEEMDVLTPSSVVQTMDGGYIMAVSATLRRVDDVGFEGHISTSYELQILKTDANGVVQWKKSYQTVDDPNHETPSINAYAEHYSIVQTFDQGYVIAGGTSSFWLIKIDSLGTVLWTKTYLLAESSGNGALNSMIQTNDGGFALAGSVYTYDGGQDYWLIKTSSQGVAQWNHTYNSGSYTDSGGYSNPRDDVATCVIQTSDGGYALAGSASLFSSSTSSLTYSTWVVKTDSKGNQIWNKGYDLLNLNGFKTTIIQTNDGGYAIAGTQNNDFCLFKITSSNQFEWSKIYGDQNADNPCGLVQLEDGGYAIAGTWTPQSTTYTTSTMGLIRTDSSGATSWIKIYSAKEDSTSNTYSLDQAYSMIRTNDGAYAMVGSTLFGSETHQDIFLVKTETLEQTPQVTPIPTPATLEPSTTSDTGQTSTTSDTPQPEQTHAPTSTNNSSTSVDDTANDSVQDGLWIILVVALIAAISVGVFVLLRRSR